MDGKHPIVVDCTDLRHAPEYADIDAAYGEAKHMAARLHRPIAVFVPIGIVQPPQVELTEYPGVRHTIPPNEQADVCRALDQAIEREGR